MRLSLFALASGLCFVAFPGLAGPSSDIPASDLYARLPLRFEPLDAQRWVAHGPGFGVGFAPDATFFQVGNRGLRLTFEGGNGQGRFEGLAKSATPTTYFGNPTRSVDAFNRLRRTAVYPGIDVVYYGKGQTLEYDFELAPGADPSGIRMRFDGADNVRLGPKGEVILELGDRQVTQNLPVVYQRGLSGEIAGVQSSYVMNPDGSVGIRLGAYDTTRALVVDPTMVFAAYLAGSSSEVPIGIGHDKNGLIYIAGYTYSPDFPLVGAAYTGFFLTTNQQAFTTVMKPLTTTGDVITYSGFFSGSFGEFLRAMTVDSEGVFYLAGVTDDALFPVTANGYLTANGGVRRSFVSVVDTKLPGASGLTYSTFFAGTKTDEPTAIAVAKGKIYVTGFTTSTDYPITTGAYQTALPGGAYDGWVAEFDPSLSGTASLVASTYLGGTGVDVPRAVAVAADGQAWVAGYTRSIDFPTTVNSFRPSPAGGGDIFVSRLNLSTMTLTYSTYLGGNRVDQPTKILVEPSGHVAVTGYTLSNNFPVTANALQSTAGGNGDAFLTILDPAAKDFSTALVYSTYFGGSDGDVAYDMRQDAAGKYYLCGYTLSLDFPTRNPLAASSTPGNSIDGFVAVIDPTASPLKALVYSSYITGPGYQVAYGVDVDSHGVIYVTGTALGDVFNGKGTPHPSPASGLNVFLLVFKL